MDLSHAYFQLAGTSLQSIVATTAGKDPTLTDRTFLWNDVIRIGSDNLVLGSGYGAFWTSELYSRLSPQVNNRPAQAHNGYLETFAQLGLLGLGLLACAIGQAIQSVKKTILADFNYGCMRLCMLITVLVLNYSEASFPRGLHLWWFIFLLVALDSSHFLEASQQPNRLTISTSC